MDQSAALLAAIKEYEASKWKVIGQKVGKPAKVDQPAYSTWPFVCADRLRRASSMRRSISQAKSEELNGSDNNILSEIPGHAWTKFAARGHDIRRRLYRDQGATAIFNCDIESMSVGIPCTPFAQVQFFFFF